MSEFIRPQVSVEEVKGDVARVTVEPLERGFGDTLGNSIRRVLLSSLEGAAVQAIRIDGVQHEFTTVEGVYEDVTDIVLNVKRLVFQRTGSVDTAECEVNIDGPATVSGADFSIPAGFELVNPELVICHLGEGAHLKMTMYVGCGRGYVSGENNEGDNDAIGIIHVDSLYSPVRRCAKTVEPCRVGQHTHFDRLAGEEENNGELEMAIEGLDLSVSSFKCLQLAGIHSLRNLVHFSEIVLLNIRNFGVKSIEEVKDKLESMGLGLKA